MKLVDFGFRTNTGSADRRLPELEVIVHLSSTLTAATSFHYGEARVVNNDPAWHARWKREINQGLQSARDDRQANGAAPANLRNAVDYDGQILIGRLQPQLGHKKELADAFTRDTQRFENRRAQCDARCGSDHVCNQLDHRDRGELYNDAHCLQSLRECFDQCVKAVIAIYAKHAPWCCETIETTVTAKASNEAGLNAKLRFHGAPETGNSRRVYVELNLPANEHLCIETYDALWWTFLHELGVHGVQELNIRPAVSDAGHCTFTEALVDRALGEAFLLRHLNFVPTELHGARAVVREFIDNVWAHRKNGGHGLRTPDQSIAGIDGTTRQLAGYALYGQLQALLDEFDLNPEKLLPTLILSLNLELSAAAPIGGRSERQRFIDCVAHWSNEGGSTVSSMLLGPANPRWEWAQRYAEAAQHFKARKSLPRSRNGGPNEPSILALIEPYQRPKTLERNRETSQGETDGFDDPHQPPNAPDTT